MSSCAPILLSVLNRSRELPPTVDVLASELKKRGIAQKCIFRAQYMWQFRTTCDDIVAGRVETQTKLRGMLCDKYADSYTPEWLTENLKNGFRAYILAARVDDYSTAKMPLDIVFTLETPRVKFRPGQNDFHTIYDVARDDAQPFLCPGHTQFFNGQDFDLLSAPLVHADRNIPSANFSSIEAVGFDSTALLQNIVTRSANNFYTIPCNYPFLGLIGRVHACLKSAQYHFPPNGSPLLGQTIPHQVLALARTPAYVLIRQSDLDEAIEFINLRLLTANSPVNPLDVVMTVEPACHTKWNAAFQEYMKTNMSVEGVKSTHFKKKPGVPVDPKKETDGFFSATVYATVFFVLIPPGGVFEVNDAIIMPKALVPVGPGAQASINAGAPVVDVGESTSRSNSSTPAERREYVGHQPGGVTFKGSVLDSDSESQRRDDFSEDEQAAANGHSKKVNDDDDDDDEKSDKSDMQTGWETQRTMESKSAPPGRTPPGVPPLAVPTAIPAHVHAAATPKLENNGVF
jgi:hypothetical protein